MRSLQAEGYQHPTAIQQKAIPGILEGRDLLGCAQTGTGKTAAFALPVLQLLYERSRASNFSNNNNNNTNNFRKPAAIKALVLTPTRELAIQVDESFRVYGKNTGLKTAVIFGGVSQHQQEMTLRKGVDILVATPGRLLDLINQRIITLSSIEIFVLDEADRMLDMGFIHDIKKLVAILPQKRHTLFFSATMPTEIKKLADSLLNDPIQVEVAPVSSAANTVSQQVFFVEKPDKRALLKHVLTDKGIKRVLVFTRTKHGADKVTKDLNNIGIKAEAIHGNKAQNARQRALENFKTGSIRVLVATDIAARGIDVEEITHVINYELPNEPETYVHRIGRTGRAGASGTAISFCDVDERPYLKDIQKLIRKPIPAFEDHPFVSAENVTSALLTLEEMPVKAKLNTAPGAGPKAGKAPGRRGFWRNKKFQGQQKNESRK